MWFIREVLYLVWTESGPETESESKALPIPPSGMVKNGPSGMERALLWWFQRPPSNNTEVQVLDDKEDSKKNLEDEVTAKQLRSLKAFTSAWQLPSI